VGLGDAELDVRLRMTRCVMLVLPLPVVYALPRSSSTKATLRRAAERWNCSVATVRRWADRYRQQGLDGLLDWSSRPLTSPRRTATRIERRVVGSRVSRRWGLARIAYWLGLPPATVHKILRRCGCPLLDWTDPATGVRIKWARPKIHYVHENPGDLVHVDIKRLGRIPDEGLIGLSAGPKADATAAAVWATGTSTTPTAPA
jgi:hypothetical protein